MIQGLNRVDPLDLTQSDWQEIYYALLDKLETSAAVRGKDKIAREWRRQLRDLIAKIGPDGKTAANVGTIPIDSC